MSNTYISKFFVQFDVSDLFQRVRDLSFLSMKKINLRHSTGIGNKSKFISDAGSVTLIMLRRAEKTEEKKDYDCYEIFSIT